MDLMNALGRLVVTGALFAPFLVHPAGSAEAPHDPALHLNLLDLAIAKSETNGRGPTDSVVLVKENLSRPPHPDQHASAQPPFAGHAVRPATSGAGDLNFREVIGVSGNTICFRGGDRPFKACGYDTTTGRIVWTREASEHPVVVDGILVDVTTDKGATADLVGVRVADGAELWRNRGAGKECLRTGGRGGLQVRDGVVAFATDGDLKKSVPALIRCFDVKNGSLVREIDCLRPAMAFGFSGDKIVYTVRRNDNTYAIVSPFAETSAEPEFTLRKIGTGNAIRMICIGSIAFIDASGSIVVRDVPACRILCRIEIEGQMNGVAAFPGDGRSFVLGVDLGILCLDLTSARMAMLPANVSTGPVVVGDDALVTTADGIVAVDRKTWQVVAREEVETAVHTGPAVVNGGVFFAGEAASLHWVPLLGHDTRGLHGAQPAAGGKSPNGERERIGEVLTRPVYRDELRVGRRTPLGDELKRVFLRPVMARYAAEHPSELEPSAREIEAMTRSTNPPMDPRLAAAFVGSWKVQRHLYDKFGGGRILWQQFGIEAFDAMRRWLEAHEAKGDFKVTVPELRTTLFRYWIETDNHRSFLVSDPIRIRREFLEPAWLRGEPEDSREVVATPPPLAGAADASRALVVSTLAGNGEWDFADGPAAGARFGRPASVAVDGAGNIVVADTLNGRVRRITPDGTVTTLAGPKETGAAEGDPIGQPFERPGGIAVGGSGNIVMADPDGNRLCRIAPDGTVTTLAGTGEEGDTDGPAAEALFRGPKGVAVDGSGNVFVADSGNCRIRKIAPDGRVSTIAGRGESVGGSGFVNEDGTVTSSPSGGFADGPAGRAEFSFPEGIAVDRAGNLYVADTSNSCIRKITPDGAVTTLAGSADFHGASFEDGPVASAKFRLPTGIAVDGAGNVLVADTSNHRIRKITQDGVVSTVAGTGVEGFVEGPAAKAQFNSPKGVAMDGAGNVIVADAHNNRIRIIRPSK